MKDIEAFRKSLHGNTPPKELSKPLMALWWDAKDDWKKAHETAQDIHNSDGAWVHAYLHRKEGDQWNANYWYTHAGRTMSLKSLQEEWEEIVKDFLNREG